jgi:hypothetical protein
MTIVCSHLFYFLSPRIRQINGVLSSGLQIRNSGFYGFSTRYLKAITLIGLRKIAFDFSSIF